jgi:hypothetical protein
MTRSIFTLLIALSVTGSAFAQQAPDWPPASDTADAPVSPVAPAVPDEAEVKGPPELTCTPYCVEDACMVGDGCGGTCGCAEGGSCVDGLCTAPASAAEAAAESLGSQIFDRVLIQLNWGDDNLLLGSGETRENSPDPNFSRCARTQIDGLTGKDCSQGTSRLGLYKAVDIGDGFSAAGALVLGLGVVTDPESSKAGNVSLYDLGSYLRLDKAFTETSSMQLEMYPVDARPMKLGFHPDIEWGTKDEFPENFRRGAAPGLKLGFKAGGFYAFAGAKTALIKTPLEIELSSDIGNRILFSTRTFYGALGGLGLDLPDLGLSIEANGGFFHKGTLTKEGVLGKDIFSGGGSLRLGYRQGLPIGLRIDSSLYQRTVAGAQSVEKEVYDGSFAMAATAEGTLQVQNLSDFELPGSTDLEWAYASHVGLKFKVSDLRLHAEARMRSLTHITAQVPGFFPYTTIPENAETVPELQGLISVDYRMDNVTLAVTGGVRMPATYRGLAPTGAGEDAASAGIRTVVVSEADAGGWYILPAGIDAQLVGWGELGLKWHPAPEFALMGELLYGHDGNRTQVERDSSGHAIRVFTQPHILGINLLGQFLF